MLSQPVFDMLESEIEENPGMMILGVDDCEEAERIWKETVVPKAEENICKEISQTDAERRSVEAEIAKIDDEMLSIFTAESDLEDLKKRDEEIKDEMKRVNEEERNLIPEMQKQEERKKEIEKNLQVVDVKDIALVQEIADARDAINSQPLTTEQKADLLKEISKNNSDVATTGLKQQNIQHTREKKQNELCEKYSMMREKFRDVQQKTLAKHFRFAKGTFQAPVQLEWILEPQSCSQMSRAMKSISKDAKAHRETIIHESGAVQRDAFGSSVKLKEASTEMESLDSELKRLKAKLRFYEKDEGESFGLQDELDKLDREIHTKRASIKSLKFQLERKKNGSEEIERSYKEALTDRRLQRWQDEVGPSLKEAWHFLREVSHSTE